MMPSLRRGHHALLTPCNIDQKEGSKIIREKLLTEEE